MLGLPSTTEVGRRMPKEAFAGRLKLTPAQRASLTNDVERIAVANSLKGGTVNIPAGDGVSEILVLAVALKRRDVPRDLLRAIAEQNPHKLLFCCTHGDECALAVLLSDLAVSPWRALEGLRLELDPASLGASWDAMASQVAFGDTGSATETAEERYANDARLASMREELARLEARCMKEKQFVKKNELFAKAKRLRAEIAAFEGGR